MSSALTVFVAPIACQAKAISEFWRPCGNSAQSSIWWSAATRVVPLTWQKHPAD